MACALESLKGTAFQSALLSPEEKIQALADPEPAGEDAAFGPEPPTQHLHKQSLLVLRLTDKGACNLNMLPCLFKVQRLPL